MNDFYNASGNPAVGSPGSSQVMRDEFASVETGFDKMPALAGNAGKRVLVNETGSALTLGNASEMRVALTDQAIANSTVFVDDAALFGFALTAGGVYRVEGLLIFEAADETPDVKLMFVAPETPVIHAVKILFNDANDTDNPDTVQTGEGVSSERLGLSTTALNTMWLNGIIEAHAANDTTWRLQWAQFEAHAGAVTRKAGSYIELTRLA